MSDLADIIADLDRIDREREAVMVRLRAATRAEPGAPPDLAAFPDDWIKPSQAEKTFRVHRSVLYRIGIRHLKVPGGCSRSDEKGRLEYSKTRLQAYFEKNPIRRQSK